MEIKVTTNLKSIQKYTKTCLDICVWHIEIRNRVYPRLALPEDCANYMLLFRKWLWEYKESNSVHWIEVTVDL